MRSLLLSGILAFLVRSLASAGPAELTEAPDSVRIDNGAVALTVRKETGEIVSLRRAGGPDVLGRGRTVYFDANGRGPNGGYPKDYWRIGSGAFRVVRRTPALVEVAKEGAGGERFPFRVELHYVVRADDPGVYCYVVYRHEKSMPAGDVGQTRVVMKLREDLFDHYVLNDRREGPILRSADPSRPARQITDATVVLPDGRIATKYNLADFEDEHPVYGMTGGGAGTWMISPSREYVNGGPTKQDLCLHQETAIVLRMLQSGHFLASGQAGLHITGDWTKLYGPFLLYVNGGAAPAALWADAERRAAEEDKRWPYAWMTDPAYALRRGAVSGRLTLPGGKAPADARVILAAPDRDWQLQGDGYLFWTHGRADGRFRLPNVRPGRYTLYAFAPGVVGEYRRDGVAVEAGGRVDLGRLDWRPEQHGRMLWQVGVPDRSAGEFRHGGEPRQFGLWALYPIEFPNDVSFTIGRSREREDWNYCQAVVQRPDGSWHVPEWRVLFTQPSAPTGRAYLTLGVAGASHEPTVVVSVNGKEVGRIRLPGDPSVYREANEAGQFSRRVLAFDAALLRRGENTLSLRLDARTPPAGPPDPYALPREAVMWDFLRLEVEESRRH